MFQRLKREVLDESFVKIKRSLLFETSRYSSNSSFWTSVFQIPQFFEHFLRSLRLNTLNFSIFMVRMMLNVRLLPWKLRRDKQKSVKTIYFSIKFHNLQNFFQFVQHLLSTSECYCTWNFRSHSILLSHLLSFLSNW